MMMVVVVVGGGDGGSVSCCSVATTIGDVTCADQPPPPPLLLLLLLLLPARGGGGGGGMTGRVPPHCLQGQSLLENIHTNHYSSSRGRSSYVFARHYLLTGVKVKGCKYLKIVRVRCI